jgi:hypothetical protein
MASLVSTRKVAASCGLPAVAPAEKLVAQGEHFADLRFNRTVVKVRICDRHEEVFRTSRFNSAVPDAAVPVLTASSAIP